MKFNDFTVSMVQYLEFRMNLKISHNLVRKYLHYIQEVRKGFRRNWYKIHKNLFDLNGY